MNGTPTSVRLASQRVVAAAREYFFAHGFRRVTMDDLAKELGMSKKTLYRRFASKSSLVKAVLLNKFHDIDRDLRRVSESDTDVSATLRELLVCIQRHTGEIQPPFVRDIKQAAPELFALIEARRRVIIPRHFGNFFARARKAGLVRTDVSAELITEMLLGSVQAILNPAKLQELGLTPQSGFTAVISIILDGVTTGPDRKGRARR